MTFTSIKTTGGWSTNTVTEAYDLLFRLALKARPMCRQFVDVRPGQLTHKGSSQTLQIENYFAEADIVSATTALDEETDVTPTKTPATSKVTLTPTEYGFVVSRTRKLKNRGMVDVDPAIALKVAAHCGDTIDRLLQTEMRAGTNVSYGGDATSAATLAAGDKATAHQIRLAVTKLRSASVDTRDGQFYAGAFHPDVVLNLREETGSGAWRTPKEYVDPGEIYRGEIGEFEGVRFMQTPTLLWGADSTHGDDSDEGEGALGAIVYRSFILGREALAESVVEEAHTEISPITDKLNRFVAVGWYADLDFSMFRQAAQVQLLNTAS